MAKYHRLVHLKTVLAVLFYVLTPILVNAQVWTVLSVDAKGDGRDPSLADAAQLSYRYDRDADLIWFRIALYGRPNEQAFGVNLVLDTGKADADKLKWWGGNKEFRFDKLVTAWVTRGSNGYEGTVGVADTAGVSKKNFTNLLQNNIQIRVEGDSLLIGLRKTDISDGPQLKLVAAVGSNERWNDDIPSSGSASLDLSAQRPKRGLREIDVSRNNFSFPSGYQTLAENRPPVITRKGKGRQPLILIPGVTSGNEAFDTFIRRNQSLYKFYVITPPGLMGTPARALPSESVSNGMLPWTRRLESDILDLIKKEKLRQPVVISHGYPGSLAAHEIAIHHPEVLGGIVDIATSAVQPFPSPTDPSRRTPATPDERVLYVDEAWARKWFKYVTPETWESNNYPSSILANDPILGERVRQQLEAVPLQVKIRYLMEFMAADQTNELTAVKVPLLVLRSGFNEKLLADPLIRWAKVYFLDSWNPFSSNPQIRILTIPDARLLILDDQPQFADDAIKKFSQELHRESQH